MKEIKFKKSKGEFVIVDMPSYEEIEKELQIFGHDQGLTNADLNIYFRHILPDFNKCYNLSEITENQAKEIVEGYNGYYNTYTEEECGNMANSAIESLHSLIKSKGIHLFQNPYDEAWKQNAISQYSYSITEQKTFYNPYIFKLNDE